MIDIGFPVEKYRAVMIVTGTRRSDAFQKLKEIFTPYEMCTQLSDGKIWHIFTFNNLDFVSKYARNILSMRSIYCFIDGKVVSPQDFCCTIPCWEKKINSRDMDYCFKLRNRDGSEKAGVTLFPCGRCGEHYISAFSYTGYWSRIETKKQGSLVWAFDKGKMLERRMLQYDFNVDCPGFDKYGARAFIDALPAFVVVDGVKWRTLFSTESTPGALRAIVDVTDHRGITQTKEAWIWGVCPTPQGMRELCEVLVRQGVISSIIAEIALEGQERKNGSARMLKEKSTNTFSQNYPP